MNKTIFVLAILFSCTSYSQNRDEDFLKVKKGILFPDGTMLGYTPATAKQQSFFYVGNRALIPLPVLQCPNPNTNTLPQFINNGAFISRAPAAASGSSNLTNSSLTFYSAPWDGNGFIEVEGVDKNGQDRNSLLINYFCHRNTYINTGWNIPGGVDGGTVFIGSKVDMQKSLKIGWSQNPNIDLNTAIEINQNDQNGSGIKINTYNTVLKAYSVMRNDGKFTFLVNGDGKTQIGAEKVGAGPHTDAMLTVSGKVACKEVRVFNNASGYWADFVFEKNYQLMPLLELEKYYKSNKHLPNIPTSKEIKANGNDLAKTDALLLQKIEELTLYVVQLQKEIDALKKRFKDY